MVSVCPHQSINLGGVHCPEGYRKGCPQVDSQVTLYKPHTAEEYLRRRRPGRHSQVLPDHSVQARELLHVMLQGVCVKGHLLHSRVGI
jgi:hypothetical protein